MAPGDKPRTKVPSQTTGRLAAPAPSCKPPSQAPDKDKWPRDVMIIPDVYAGKASSLYRDNRKFALQWASYAPYDRATVSLGSKQTLEEVIEEAAQKARLDQGADCVIIPRRIILFIGHGGADGERHQEMTSFDTVPESGLFLKHKQKITGDVVEFGRLIDSGEILVKNPDSSTPEFFQNNVKLSDSNGIPYEEQILVKYRKLRQLRRIAAILKKYKVGQFIVLSCAAGSDPHFAPGLSKVLQTRVGLYKKLVAVGGITYTVTGQNQAKSLAQIWLVPLNATTEAAMEAVRPKIRYNKDHSPNDHASLHEIPEPEVFAP